MTREYDAVMLRAANSNMADEDRLIAICEQQEWQLDINHVQGHVKLGMHRSTKTFDTVTQALSWISRNAYDRECVL